jgi:prolyl-tRNA synthetase
MKDLYTFDATEDAALETYAAVQAAYRALFDELGLPYLVAEADSGNMGGNLSHEYLYPSPTGEDTILTCTECNYTSNVEAAVSRPMPIPRLPPDHSQVAIHHSISLDRKTLINTYYIKSTPTATGNTEPNEVNLHRIKEIVPELDPSIQHPVELFQESFTSISTNSKPGTYPQIINLFDATVPHSITEPSFPNHTDHFAASVFTADKGIQITSITANSSTGQPLTLLKPRVDDRCPRCDEGRLKSILAIELGHTFNLGTRYTVPFTAGFHDAEQKWVPMQQGSHGLGVSRMIPAIAEGYRDADGLGWPRVVAPFEVAVVCHPDRISEAEAVYDILNAQKLDVVLDDRGKGIVWKMKDADLVGYPITVVMGRAWNTERKVEVQCRRKAIKAVVGLEELGSVIAGISVEL